MKSLVKNQILILSALVILSQVAFGAFSVTVSPNQIPKGAYVNGSDGDQYFFQSFKVFLQLDADWADNDDIIFTLPAGVSIADTDGDGALDDEVYFGSASALNIGIVAAQITVLSNSITINIPSAATNAIANDDEVIVVFPITTESNPSSSTVTYNFTTSDPTDLDDTNPTTDITVTYKDIVDVIAWAPDYSGGDQSSVKGDLYPTAGLADISIGLLDYIDDADKVGTQVIDDAAGGANDNFGLLAGNFDNDDTSDEITYTLWASQDSGLSRVNYNNAIKPIQTTDDAIVPDANEDDTFDGGAAGAGLMYQLDGTRLAEGNWWLYVTSNYTNDWVLGRSDSVDIRHYPAFAALDAAGGMDYDELLVYEFGGAGNDNVENIYLGSGGTIGKDGLLVASNDMQSVDFYWSYEDVDDNAHITIFRSSDDGLTTTDLVLTGDNGSEVVDSIGTKSVKITTTSILEESSTGFYTWTVYTNSDTYEPAGTYYIYYVTNDSTNQQVYQLTKNDGTTRKKVIIKHYPYFKFDEVTNLDADNEVFDTALDDIFALSWGTDINNDLDANGNATIKFYVISGGDGLGDILTGTVLQEASAIELVADANVTYLGMVMEDDDGKADNRFMVDMKSLPAGDQHFVAYIYEGADHLLVQYDAPYGPQTKGAGGDRTMDLQHGQYETTYFPTSGETVTLTGDDEFDFNWNSYDRDVAIATNVHIFIAPSGFNVTGIGTQYDSFSGNATATLFWITSTTGENPLGTTAGPTAESGKYTLDVSDLTTDWAGNTVNPSGFYDVYYFTSWEGDMGTASGATNEAWLKADGVVDFSGSSATLTDFYLSPNKAVLSKGDTLTIEVRAYSPSSALDVRILTISLDVPDTYFTVLDQGSGAAFSGETVNLNGTVLANSMTQTGGNWELNYSENDATPSENLNAAGGSKVASFQVYVDSAASGTEYISKLITFVNTATRATSIIDENGNTEASTLPGTAADLLVAPPGSISGQVELEVLTDQGETVDFFVLPRGSYTAITDSDFLSANGGANSDGSVSVELGVDGAYQLLSIPTGDYDLLVHKDYHLDKMATDVQVRVVTDVSSTDFTAASMLLAGDIAGYDHDGDNSTLEQGDNQIDPTDVTAVSDAFGATADSVSTWNPAADLDGDGKIYLVDYNTIVSNSGENGDGLLYKGRNPSDANDGVVIELIALEKSGDQATFAIRASDLSSLHAYAIEMDFNSMDWEILYIDDGLANRARTVPITKIHYSGATIVSAIIGRNNASREQDMDLARITLRARHNHAEAVTISDVSLIDGNGTLSKGIIGGSTEALPVAYSLSQNFPNPFNPTTTISFSMPDAGDVSLIVYNLLGQEINSLVSGNLKAGIYKTVWSGHDNNGRIVSSGLYFYRLVVNGNYIATKKMVMLK